MAGDRWPTAISEEGKICREVGATRSFQAKVLNNEIWAIHQRAYKNTSPERRRAP